MAKKKKNTSKPNKKDKKASGKKEKSSSSSILSSKSVTTAAPDTMTDALQVTDMGLEKSWSMYGSAVTGWTSAIITMQKAHVNASISWLEVCRKALEFDTELLKSGHTYYKDVWYNACLQSAKHHARVLASYTALQTDALYDIQTDTINEYGRRWRHMFE